MNTPIAYHFKTDGAGEHQGHVTRSEGGVLMQYVLNYGPDGEGAPEDAVDLVLVGERDNSYVLMLDQSVTIAAVAENTWITFPPGDVNIYVSSADPDTNYVLALWVMDSDVQRHYVDMVGGAGESQGVAVTSVALPAGVVHSIGGSITDADGLDIGAATVDVQMETVSTHPGVSDVNVVGEFSTELNGEANTDVFVFTPGGKSTITVTGMMPESARVRLYIDMGNQ